LLLLAVLALTGQYGLSEILSVGLFAVSYLLLDYLRSLHQSEMRFREYSLLEVTRATLITVVTVVVVARSSRAGGETHAATLVILWQGIAMAAMVMPWILWVRRARISWQHAAIWTAWRKQLDSEIGALFLYFAAVGVFGQVEVFVLKRFGSEMDLAVFSAAFRYYSLLMLATGATNAVLLPLSQRLDSADSFLRLLAGGRIFFLLFAGLVVVSAPVLLLFAPLLGLEKYPGFFPVYCVLCVASIQAAFLSPHVGALMKLKQYRFLDVLVCVTAVASVVVCAVFVRSFGAIGAAVSYCAANLVMNSIASRRARRMTRPAAVTTAGL
jgi:O-antigen/teichoic acid export membrane protein